MGVVWKLSKFYNFRQLGFLESPAMHRTIDEPSENQPNNSDWNFGQLLCIVQRVAGDLSAGRFIGGQQQCCGEDSAARHAMRLAVLGNCWIVGRIRN